MRITTLPKLLVVLGVTLLVTHLPADESSSGPREFTYDDGSRLVVYPPQIEEWTDFKMLSGRLVAGYHPPGNEREFLGVAEFTATSETDHDSRTVIVDQIRVTGVSFPGVAEDTAADAERAVRALFPEGPVEVPLDNILASLDRGRAASAGATVSNEPPRLLWSRRDAILVALDGEPAFARIGDTDLLVVLNTPSILVRHMRTEWYYLLYDEGWLHAPALTGPWGAASSLPAAFRDLPAEPRWAELRKRVPGKPLAREQAPDVYVATDPTELIVTDGEPTFRSIPGTRLLYVDNTGADLFLNSGDGMYYVLLSGRWFRTRGPGHALAFCTPDLPEDFRRIPPDHICGRVLASTPGTDQADEARLAAQIPHTAQVDRRKTTITVTYAGDPIFVRVAGTRVEYATNTTFDVFRVGGRYYCCHEGIWFVAVAPTAAWIVCADVPREIYVLPSDCPKYDVTYVRVYRTTPSFVVFGYLPGYLGCYVAGGVVVWGTGWRWRYPREYWVHYHRHWQPRRRPIPWHRHVVFGHARYYDHWSGLFRVTTQTRSRYWDPNPRRSTYTTWKGAAENVRVRRPAPTPPNYRKVVAVRKRTDLYAGRDGSVYRRQGTAWLRHERGAWKQVSPPVRKPDSPIKRTTAPVRRPTPPKSAAVERLDRTARAREQADSRKKQYERYRATRDARTRRTPPPERRMPPKRAPAKTKRRDR